MAAVSKDAGWSGCGMALPSERGLSPSRRPYRRRNRASPSSVARQSSWVPAKLMRR